MREDLEMKITLSQLKFKIRRRWTFYKRVLAFYVFRMFPIRKNKVVFSSYQGKGYGDNGKYMAEALLAQDKQYDLVWLVNEMDTEMPSSIRKVKAVSFRGIFEMCTAKVWVDNCRKLNYIRKRKKQYYIQTWHGDVGMKMCEGDAAQTLAEWYIKAAKRDSQMANLFVCGNQWMADLYHRAYWYSGEVAVCGYPRRDIFYQQNEGLAESIRNRLGISKEAKVLLYAPTFRTSAYMEDLQLYDLNWNAVLDALQERFGGKWVGMIRLHPNSARRASELALPEDVLNVTNYPDMQELLLISDCVVSDYSSSLFEFAVMKRPGFIYAVDIEEYKAKCRGLYFSFDEIPFGVSRNDTELVQLIKEFDEDRYQKEIDEFYTERLRMTEKGDASAYLAKRIAEVCDC